MSELTEDEIRKIVHRASLLQKLSDSSAREPDDPLNDSLDDLFAITDSLELDRHFVQEAFTEYNGVHIQDPIMIDSMNKDVAEVLGYANNGLDAATVNEFRSLLEYHFNTEGKAVRRKNRILWRAKPKGASKIFSTVSSPQAEIDFSGSQLKIRISQNLETLNKLMYPTLFIAGITFMGSIISMSEGSSEPIWIVSAAMLGVTFLISRVVRRKKIKRKKQLAEVMEAVQQIFERRFISKKRKTVSSERIQIPSTEFEIETNAETPTIDIVKE